MYIYIYIHTCIYIYIYTYIHIHVFVLHMKYVQPFSALRSGIQGLRASDSRLIYCVRCICICLYIYIYTHCIGIYRYVCIHTYVHCRISMCAGLGHPRIGEAETRGDRWSWLAVCATAIYMQYCVCILRMPYR